MEQIKYDVEDEDFFNFEFYAAKSMKPNYRDEFWFKFAHPIYNQYIPHSRYPNLKCMNAMKLSNSVDSRLDLSNQFQNERKQYKYFVKFLVKKENLDQFSTTIKK